MDIQKLYRTIFPIGGIDDNNRYSRLTADQINSVQLVEPSLPVSMLGLSKKDKYDKNNQPDKYAYRIPIVSIDNYRINPIDLTGFKLDYSGFVPTITVEFVDSSNDMLSTSVVKDGSIIKIYVGGNGDELYYKPIRQDFIITGIKKTGGGNQNYGGYLKYRVYGKLNVPYGYRKESWCMGDCSTMQALFNLSVYTGLGFATNFTRNNSPDVMKWTNDECNTYFDFIEEISAHACYSPNTFFTSFIDQYNVLNFVECHSLLSHGGTKTGTPAMIYRNFPPSSLPNYTGGEKTTKNQLPLNPEDDDLNNTYQKLSYYFLSNNDFFDGWSNFIEEYIEVNNCYSSLTDGYKSHVQYSDSNRSGWGFTECQFNIKPIDNLDRDSDTQKINSLPDDVSQESYIPLNLMQMTKKDYQDAKDGIGDMANVESFTSFGEVDTSNMFKLYYFSEVQNRYQMNCLKKCGLKVILQNYNPAITRFSRIWVDIYDKNINSNTQITKSEIQKNDTGDYLEYKNLKNNNILKYEDEGVIDMIDDSSRKNKNWPRGEFNRALSGWYVITEMKIYYSPDDNNLKMELLLNRIEYQPCFKNEYDIAKKAIDKYKEYNTMDDLVVSKDDPSYRQ